MEQIIVFTLDGCGHCVELKNRFNEENINFTEIEVTQNKEIWDKVVEQTGHNALPSVYIPLDGGDSGPIFIPERDYQTQDELIKKVKKFILERD